MDLTIIAKPNKGEGHLTFGFYSSKEAALIDYNKFPYLEKEGYKIINMSVK